MKFAYRPASVQLDADVEPITVHRPILRIKIAGLQGKATIHALADTGADCSIFSLEVADRIGVNLQLDRPLEVCGIGDNDVELFAGEVELELRHSGKAVHWKSSVLFGDVESNLLGQLGFFEFFTVSFDYDARKFEVLPNSRLTGN